MEVLAGDGLCGGGVVGFEQQAAVVAVDHFIVGVAVKGGQVEALVLDIVDNIGKGQQV